MQQLLVQDSVQETFTARARGDYLVFLEFPIALSATKTPECTLFAHFLNAHLGLAT